MRLVHLFQRRFVMSSMRDKKNKNQACKTLKIPSHYCLWWFRGLGRVGVILNRRNSILLYRFLKRNKWYNEITALSTVLNT